MEKLDLKLIIEELLAKNGLPENVKVTVKVESAAEKIMADSTFINRIMDNLVNNAVQAMPNGGKLFIKAYKEANDVVIDVTDTGIGVPEALKKNCLRRCSLLKRGGKASACQWLSA